MVIHARAGNVEKNNGVIKCGIVGHISSEI